MGELPQPNPDQADPATTFPTSDVDPVRYLAAGQQQAGLQAIQGLGESPDDAARAHELSEATGVPSPLIHGDLENFESQHKAALTSALIKNNSFLQDYVLGHPMAAKVSNDDWGTLDEFTDALHKHERCLG